MSDRQLTARQTLLLGQASASVELAKLAAKEAEDKLIELESSLIVTDTPFSDAITEAVGEIEEVRSALDGMEFVDFLYESQSERRVAKMLRGIGHG